VSDGLFFTLIEYLFITDYKFKRCFMNPFSLSVEELEKSTLDPSASSNVLKARQAATPGRSVTGELLTALYFRILNCSPR
jgi:hypothetical protein